MKTFDFFDTLVTRLVANPRDVFTLVGQSIEIDNFKALRVAAELKARRLYKGEVTFQQIYAQIDLDEILRRRAYEEELRIERGLMSLIAENGSSFSNDDGIISDMYHSADFLSDVLRDVLPGKRPKMILVSSERELNKHTGGMWRFVRNQYPDHSQHIGDDFEADVRQARNHGLRASHYVSSRLNRAEAELAAEGLDGSMVAGASRATRLALIDSETTVEERAIINTFASVFGPLIFGFSKWVIETCLAQGIRNVFFLARDGKIIGEVCDALVQHMKLPLATAYVYASRQALHLPGYKGVEAAETWLLDGTRVLSLETVAERGKIPVEILIKAAKSKLEVSSTQNLSQDQRRMLAEIIRDPAVLIELENSAGTAFDTAREYYAAQGMFGASSFAVVDIGWNGRMQSSLRSLADKAVAPVDRILGLYVCLARAESRDIRDDFRGYLAEPPHKHGRPIYDRYRNVLEAAFSADHATTVGFERDRDRVSPIFGEPWSQNMQRRVELQHRVIRTFINNIIKTQEVAKQQIAPPKHVIANTVRNLLVKPNKEQALALVDFEFADGQGNDTLAPIARRLSFRKLVTNRKDWGYWTEGTLRASGFGYLIGVRRFYRAVKYRSR